jgi:hypothetical protein
VIQAIPQHVGRGRLRRRGHGPASGPGGDILLNIGDDVYAPSTPRSSPAARSHLRRLRQRRSRRRHLMQLGWPHRRRVRPLVAELNTIRSWIFGNADDDRFELTSTSSAPDPGVRQRFARRPAPPTATTSSSSPRCRR